MVTATLSLFDPESERQLEYSPPDDRLTIVSGHLGEVRGIDYIPEFITCGEERVLLWQADQEGEWLTHWSRRTKFFGVKYDRAARSVNLDAPIAQVPAWSNFVRERLVSHEIFNKLPTQMGINEYLPGQGIAQHVDYFGGTVVSLSLGSGCIMEFTLPDCPEARASIWLAPRSIVVLNGDARNVWQHGIRGRLSDIVGGHTVKRNRRVSLTFRDVVIE